MYDLRKIKICKFASQETTCFEAELTKNGKTIAHVSNDGHGGCNRTHFISDAERQEFNNFLDTQPPIITEWSPEGIKTDADIFVANLLEKHEEQKWLKRHTKAKTVVKLKSHNKGEWTVFSMPFTANVAAQLRKKYGDDLLCIANENLDLAANVSCR